MRGCVCQIRMLPDQFADTLHCSVAIWLEFAPGTLDVEGSDFVESVEYEMNITGPPGSDEMGWIVKANRSCVPAEDLCRFRLTVVVSKVYEDGECWRLTPNSLWRKSLIRLGPGAIEPVH